MVNENTTNTYYDSCWDSNWTNFDVNMNSRPLQYANKKSTSAPNPPGTKMNYAKRGSCQAASSCPGCMYCDVCDFPPLDREVLYGGYGCYPSSDTQIITIPAGECSPKRAGPTFTNLTASITWTDDYNWYTPDDYVQTRCRKAFAEIAKLLATPQSVGGDTASKIINNYGCPCMTWSGVFNYSVSWGNDPAYGWLPGMPEPAAGKCIATAVFGMKTGGGTGCDEDEFEWVMCHNDPSGTMLSAYYAEAFEDYPDKVEWAVSFSVGGVGMSEIGYGGCTKCETGAGSISGTIAGGAGYYWGGSWTYVEGNSDGSYKDPHSYHSINHDGLISAENTATIGGNIVWGGRATPHLGISTSTITLADDVEPCYPEQVVSYENMMAQGGYKTVSPLQAGIHQIREFAKAGRGIQCAGIFGGHSDFYPIYGHPGWYYWGRAIGSGASHIGTVQNNCGGNHDLWEKGCCTDWIAQIFITNAYYHNGCIRFRSYMMGYGEKKASDLTLNCHGCSNPIAVIGAPQRPVNPRDADWGCCRRYEPAPNYNEEDDECMHYEYAPMGVTRRFEETVVCDAGDYQEKNAGDLVTLDGSGSSSANGYTLYYKWTQIKIRPEDPTVTLSSSTAQKPTFTAPEVCGEYADLVFQLRVTSKALTADPLSGVDPGEDGTPCSVTIRIAGCTDPPNANAGSDLNRFPNASVTLNGSGSTLGCASCSPLRYAWTQISGTSVTLTNANTSAPSFTAPSSPSTLVFQLTVTDLKNDTDTDTVTVNVTESTCCEDLFEQGNSLYSINLSTDIGFPTGYYNCVAMLAEVNSWGFSYATVYDLIADWFGIDIVVRQNIACGTGCTGAGCKYIIDGSSYDFGGDCWAAAPLDEQCTET